MCPAALLCQQASPEEFCCVVLLQSSWLSRSMSGACASMRNVSMPCSMAWMPLTGSSAQYVGSKKALGIGIRFSTLLQQSGLRNVQREAAVHCNKIKMPEQWSKSIGGVGGCVFVSLWVSFAKIFPCSGCHGAHCFLFPGITWQWGLTWFVASVDCTSAHR